MQQIIIILLGLILAVPTYGVSIIIAIWLFNINGKRLRNIIFHNLITQAYLYSEGDMTTDLFFYESAEKFAEENGGTPMTYRQGWMFELVIHGEKLSVMFNPSDEGNLDINVKTAEEAEKAHIDIINRVIGRTQEKRDLYNQ